MQSQLRKLYLHPKTVAREKQTKFVDSLRFIPLEIKEDIEISNNYNIEVTGNYILLIDYMNKRLLVYLKNGKFLKQIAYNKLGDSFYPNYQEVTNQVTFFGNNKNYSLTPKDLVKIKLDWNNPRNKKYFKKYTLNLNDPLLTIKKGVPAEKDIVQVRHFYDDYYVQSQITVSPLFADSVDYEFKVYKSNQLVKTFFPYNRINEPRFLYTQENVSFNKTDTANIHILTRPFYDTIYKMKGDSLFAAYQLVLPLENTLPPSFYNKPFKNKTERENFYRNNGWMLQQIYSFYETPRFIYFMVRYLSNFDSYIYEKQTDVTYKTRNVKADSSQYNLQLFPTFGLMRERDKFYKSQKASDLLDFFDKNKNVAVPKELEEFINSKPPANTPVIVEFKFKN
ncbi:hypothetical protein SAE01_32920 [Segetibacter aerophilus]|uniref:6-bladed beta-propeller n=1 Tax=Segetibacter aerophilus TaxID=670293 RepID=A0A512BFR0_9BACT|nr:hypothetical protein SAE01_32920 [Segetibacter aerophilus]